MKKNWILKYSNLDNETQENRIKELQKKYNLGRLAAQVLSHLKLESDEKIKVFLNPTRDDFYDPFMMPDMNKAVERIVDALKNNEKIIVYGDYDADGITSTATLKKFFDVLNVDIGIYIPNRLTEGYGVNKNAIDKISDEGYNLIITVDTGITAVDEVKYASEKGLDVIVTDHHEPGEEIPNAVAVVDCKRKDNKYPFRELAGCGVAFKLAQALCKRLEINENEALKLLDFTCIGTISDIVPLVDENRTITKLGMLLLKQTRRTGIRELIKQAGFKGINTTTVSFGIAPRVNACGRMGHQEIAMELFLTENPIKARDLATRVEQYNKERQQIEKRIYDEALKIAENEDQNNKIIVLGKENWNHGIIGIVSSKITEKFYKPSILVCFEGKNAKGSGRSIPGFDLHEAFLKCSKNLTMAGGHSMAGGLSLETDKFNDFKKDIEEYANKKITDEMLISNIEIDDEIELEEADVDSVTELEKLEPFGEGNNKPVFLFKDLMINSIKTMSEGKHVKIQLTNKNTSIDAVGFNMGELASQYQIDDHIDVVGTLDINKFNNKTKVQLLIKDMRKAI